MRHEYALSPSGIDVVFQDVRVRKEEAQEFDIASNASNAGPLYHRKHGSHGLVSVVAVDEKLSDHAVVVRGNKGTNMHRAIQAATITVRVEVPFRETARAWLKISARVFRQDSQLHGMAIETDV